MMMTILDIWAFAESGQFQTYKTEIQQFSGLAKDALHVHVGLAIFILVRLCWRWRGGWIIAWLAALAAALTGEWLDLRGEYAIGAPRPDSEHWHDIWNTMLWPTILLFLGRFLQPRKDSRASEGRKDAGSGDLAEQPFKQPPAV